MTDFVQKALARQPAAPEWLVPFNALGRESSRGRTLPTIRVEDWKYTSLRALEEGAFATAPEPVAPDAGLARHFHIPDLDAYRLVFVNGHYSAALSDARDLPEGVTLTTFADADENAIEDVRAHLGELSGDERLFSALNASWLVDGVFLRVARNTKVGKPVQLVWLTTPQTEAFGIAQRLLVVMEEGSEAAVLEQFVSTGDAQNAFTNGVSEFVIGDNAQLRHCRLHLEEPGAIHVGAVHASVGRNALLSGFHVALGGRLKRNDIQVRMRGEGGHCELNGVYLPRNREVIDYHTCVEHEVPNCTSDETFRGIIADEARAVFNGRIHIHRDAQKTSAHLSNRNLLTSNKAEVDTKPELEIYADDVQCSHGATVAQLDEGHLYYLLTRGVSEQEAQVLLSFGFINEILNRIRRDALQNYLRAELRGLFAQDDYLTRHLL
ncbi:MAG: Fe-S cluster assembly protein SufD [Porticoccaceae bacterium]